jgi:hypothetical protein
VLAANTLRVCDPVDERITRLPNCPQILTVTTPAATAEATGPVTVTAVTGFRPSRNWTIRRDPCLSEPRPSGRNRFGIRRSGVHYICTYQCCQIFLCTTYQNREKYTKRTQNIPNDHKKFTPGVKVHPWGRSSPLGSKFTPGVKVHPYDQSSPL